MAEHLASIFGTGEFSACIVLVGLPGLTQPTHHWRPVPAEKDRVNCPFYFKIG
jgi:hypothetical protein